MLQKYIFYNNLLQKLAWVIIVNNNITNTMPKSQSGIFNGPNKWRYLNNAKYCTAA